MPYLKTVEFSVSNPAIRTSVRLKVCVNSSGMFYCYVDPGIIDAVKGVFDPKCLEHKNGKLKVVGDSLGVLLDDIKNAYTVFFEPEVTQEHVIIYNIESHVSFAEDAAGNIYPNSGFENSEWCQRDEMYGAHHANAPSKGGYTLTVGARAMTKTVYRYGESEKVKYETYYAGGSHHGKENPAEKLNSWCSFELDNFKEIPYSDQAALFFYNLLYGMARLSQMIQQHTFDQEDLTRLISSGAGPLLPGGATRLNLNSKETT